MPPSGAGTSSEYSRIIGDNDESGNESPIIEFVILHGKKLWWIIVVVAMVIATGLLISAYGRPTSMTPAVRTGDQVTKDVESLYKVTFPISDVRDRASKQLVDNTRNDNVLKSSGKLSLTTRQLQESFKAAEKAQSDRLEIEQQLRDAGYINKPGSPAGKHSAFSDTPEQAQKLAIDGFTMDQASKYLANKLKLTKEQARLGIGKVGESATNLQETCIEPLNLTTCVALNSATNTYHSSDGLCNNVNNPGWGSINQPYRRVMLPVYDDGISTPRSKASDGSPLPHPRKVSTVLHSSMQKADEIASLLMPTFGQFLAHEIMSTAQGVGTSSRVLNCCKGDVVAPVLHPECLPFYVSPGDELFYQEGEKCTNMWRSARYPSCELGPRSQFTTTTSYIDGSVIYGNTDDRVRVFREINLDNPHGYMTTYTSPDGRKLLPVSTDLLDGCNVPEHVEKGEFCFTSGDARVNENMALTSMHLLWVRQHNIIADQLAALNPTGHDGKTYFETREIIIAQMQHITYNEFLPILLGKQLMDAAGLTTLTEGYSDAYDESVDASISNVFASAGYRMGHSMMIDQVKLIDSKGKTIEKVPLHQLLFDPFRLWHPGNFDAIIRGHLTAASAQVDTHFTNELTRHLFENRNGSTLGLDLAAINIQRGRDHGLPPYAEWRRACGLDAISNFDNLTGSWKEDALYLAKNVYKSAEDVDLYTGMLAEKRVPGAMVGPTLACILTDQFVRIRSGDRFWYENNKNRGRPFPLEQLQEIRKITLARIICDTSDGIKQVQLRPLEKPSATNPIVSCKSSQLAQLDYSLWYDNVNTGLLPSKN